MSLAALSGYWNFTLLLSRRAGALKRRAAKPVIVYQFRGGRVKGGRVLSVHAYIWAVLCFCALRIDEYLSNGEQSALFEQFGQREIQHFLSEIHVGV